MSARIQGCGNLVETVLTRHSCFILFIIYNLSLCVCVCAYMCTKDTCDKGHWVLVLAFYVV